jgi:hypothetical protein
LWNRRQLAHVTSSDFKDEGDFDRTSSKRNTLTGRVDLSEEQSLQFVSIHTCRLVNQHTTLDGGIGIALAEMSIPRAPPAIGGPQKFLNMDPAGPIRNTPRYPPDTTHASDLVRRAERAAFVHGRSAGWRNR